MKKSRFKKVFKGALLMTLVMTVGLQVGCASSGKSNSSSGLVSEEQIESNSTSDGSEEAAVSSNSLTSSQSGSSSKGTSTSNSSKVSVSSKAASSAANITSSQNTVSDNNGALTNGTYPPIPKDVMPIGAWVAPPKADINGRGNPSFITDEQYKMVKESGINMIYGLYEFVLPGDIDNIFKTLDLCEKYGIKYLLRDPGVENPYEDLVAASLNQYCNYPAFAGILVQDEPNTTRFDSLSEIHLTLKKLLPDKYFYVNLFPSYANTQQLFGADATNADGTMTHERYIDEYISKVKPPFLSYDFYAIRGSEGKVKQGYYKELSTYRSLSLKHNIPFWVFVQACSYNKNIRLPNEAEILWQVNTSLAYGAKGIQYFCYFTPLADTGNETYDGCFIDENGNKTEIYGYGQKANRQIAAVDQVLMNCTSKGVIVTGENIDKSLPASDMLTKYGNLSSVTGTGSGFITGCFDHKGKNAFYVANNSLLNNGNVTLHFTKSVSGTQIYNASSKKFSGSSLTISLKAGEGVLVYLD